MRLSSVLFLLFATACDSQAGVAESTGRADGGFLLMAATLTRAAANACPEARRLELRSHRGSLQILTWRVQNAGCGTEPKDPDPRTYQVASTSYEEGSKLYTGSSSSGAIWIMDDRPLGSDIAWTVEISDDGPLVRPESQVVTMQATAVDDQNLHPSGKTSYPVRLSFEGPIAEEVLTSMVFPLKIEPHSIRTANGAEHEVRIVSDLPIEHVMSQLQTISYLQSVALLK